VGAVVIAGAAVAAGAAGAWVSLGITAWVAVAGVPQAASQNT